jgi:acetyl esterase/lipase
MFRAVLEDFTPKDDAHKKFDDMVDVEKVEDVGGPDFHSDAVKGYALVHRVKGKPTSGRKCMIYFHGGGICAGTPEQHKSCTNRVAVECDCTVVNLDYRLCPECPMPGPVYDCYAGLKWVLANGEKLGIDTKRVCIYGESGGGQLVSAVAVVLADKDEGGLIKFAMPQLAMTDDMYFAEDWSKYSPVEQAQGAVTKTFQTLWQGEGKTADDYKARVKDPLVCPNNASDDQFKKMPKVLAMTTEFDALKKPTSDFAKKCEANGTLLELGVLNGCHHGHFVHYNYKASDHWFAAHARAAQLYL